MDRHHSYANDMSQNIRHLFKSEFCMIFPRIYRISSYHFARKKYITHCTQTCVYNGVAEMLSLLSSFIRI